MDALSKLRESGLTLSATNGQLAVTPAELLDGELRQLIRDNKAAILVELETRRAWWLLHYPDREPLEICRNPPATHDEVLAANPSALAAIPLTTADELLEQISARLLTEKPHWYASQSDDRRTCEQCANLAGRRCLAPKRGLIVGASPGHEPARDLPSRCEGFASKVLPCP